MNHASLLVAAVLVGCGGSSTPAAGPERPAKDVSAAMDSHFQAISNIQRLVISGDLGAARLHAEELAGSLSGEAYPDSWAPHLGSVRTAVWAIARAEHIQGAAASTAKAAMACGSCHASLGIHAVSAGADAPPERPEDMTEYMWQHLWAADEMWSGLVGPSNDAWLRGANVLAKAGLVPQGDVELDPEMVSLAAKLNIAGKTAIDAQGDERARTYGEFLGSCASCHRHHLERMD